MNQEELIKQTIESYLNGEAALQDMNLKTANELIKKVHEKAQEMGISVVAAVSDKAGRPVAVQCMDGAYIGSYDVALNKTLSSACKAGINRHLPVPRESAFSPRLRRNPSNCRPPPLPGGRE